MASMICAIDKQKLSQGGILCLSKWGAFQKTPSAPSISTILLLFPHAKEAAAGQRIIPRNLLCASGVVSSGQPRYGSRTRAWNILGLRSCYTVIDILSSHTSSHMHIRSWGSVPLHKEVQRSAYPLEAWHKNPVGNVITGFPTKF